MFTKIRVRHARAIQAEVQEYEEPASGARHIHLATGDPEMVFLVAFPTMPESSNGVAHILEHLVLSGSARYPVRDPFSAMSRRSVAHFMNAMTYADRTAFPFASTNKTDFFNLLDVYIDAVFFPLLDRLDFLQEGWRLIPEDGKLMYQGVVLNEMKGAFTDTVRAVDCGISAVLFEGTTYASESGGDPLDIPSLTHALLKEFHASHYHPSQAVFMTAGNLDPRDVQRIIEARVLSEISGRKPYLLPQLVSAWEAPRAAEIPVPTKEYGVQIAWRLGAASDPLSYCRSQLLESGLLANSSTPLMSAMESAGFGRPSMLNGVDAGRRQMMFHLGMEGLTGRQVGAARKRIWSALEGAAEKGVPVTILQAALRDMRFRSRDTSSESMPNTLKRMLRALPQVLYGGDVMNGLDCDEILSQLERDITDPGFFKALVRTLLESPDRVDAVVRPDRKYFRSRQNAEEERLAAMQAAMQEPERERLLSESRELMERLRLAVDKDVLPRICPQDVSLLPRPVLSLPSTDRAVVSIPSNGISGAFAMFDVSGMDEALWPWLQLYADLVPELGVGSMPYEEADAWRHECVPSFDIDLHAVQTQDGAGELRVHLCYCAKGLREEHRTIAAVVSESIRAPRFDEYDRLAFLIDCRMQEMRSCLADDGDEYARLFAAAPLSRLRYFENSVQGTGYLTFYRNLHKKSRSPQGCKDIAHVLETLHRNLAGSASTLIAAGTEQDGKDLAGLIDMPTVVAHIKAGGMHPAQPGLANAALHASAQVNHCCAVWAAPAYSQPHAPALAVLGELLTNQVLHRMLREEGGAYGGYAYYSKESGIFVMRSYRDPGLESTYEAFECALSWVMDSALDREAIEEAIICAIQSLDTPCSPFAQVWRAWERQQERMTEEMRERFRRGVLQCTAEQIKAAAEVWLRDKPCSRAAFVGNPEQALGGLELIELARLAGNGD
ncbi:peptidase M16 [Herbaspirillum sp. HC18]|nr:peptidase M16 [Herbaspirillum sp. HC18]